MSVAPKIAVTTDSVLVEQEPSRETRRRLEERKTVPDELDSKDAEGGAALGDPTSMRSWLSCLDIVEESFFQVGVQMENVFFLFFSVQIEQRKASKAPKNRFSKKVEREHNFQVFGQLPIAADFNAIR